MEITSEGFVRFYDKFYQNHGVILKKPIPNAQELVSKALVELDDYYQSPDFISRLTAKLVDQDLPTDALELNTLFGRLIREVKLEKLIEANLQEKVEPVGLFQQAVEMTVDFATNHPYLFGAICIATAAAVGYLLYPYVKTLLGVGGSAAAGGNAGNSNVPSSSNNSSEPLSTEALKKEQIHLQMLTDILSDSATATTYAADAMNLADKIADIPTLNSVSDTQKLLKKLKDVESYVSQAEE